MSEMEMFVGRFKEAADQSIFPTDDDDFYEMEERDGCHYVRVNDTVYSFWGIIDLDGYGFEEVLGPQDGPLLLCYWYNGGAGLHEVAEEAIERWITNETK